MGARMSLVADDVLTLDEAARYLRVSVQTAQGLAERCALPGRQVDGEWRFLKCALDDWLRGPDYRQSLLDQVGAFEDDESMPELRAAIYARRRRPETE